jgi:hypothetical protein
MIFPYNWYWLADDGRVYASATQTIVTDTDPGYVAFTGAGGTATVWPRDDAGNQTNASLQDVLRPYNLYVDLIYYTAAARQARYADDITVNGLPFSTDPVSLGGLNAAMLYTSDKQVNAFSWKLPDGSFITLNTTQIKDLQSVVAAFGQSCFVCEDETLTAIEGGTITTREQVDAAFAAVSNNFTGVATGFEKTARHRK